MNDLASLDRPPTVVDHDGIAVVRDDLILGGTKARYLRGIVEDSDETVYASPPEGGAQTAIASLAQAMGRRCTIFTAQRKEPHPRSLMVKRLGGTVVQVTPGYLSVVQSRARAYVAQQEALVGNGIKLVPFGADVDGASDAIAAAARATGLQPREVWCAAGSGVLARGLAAAWPDALRFVVQIGRALTPDEVAGAAIIPFPLKFEQRAKTTPPFPSDPFYDAKAWEVLAERRRQGLCAEPVVFWNVTGPAT